LQRGAFGLGLLLLDHHGAELVAHAFEHGHGRIGLLRGKGSRQ
jgi:hypothetical protein